MLRSMLPRALFRLGTSSLSISQQSLIRAALPHYAHYSNNLIGSTTARTFSCTASNNSSNFESIAADQDDQEENGVPPLYQQPSLSLKDHQNNPSSRNALLKQHKVARECFYKILDIANGKIDKPEEPLSFEVLHYALNFGVRKHAALFVKEYFETWWSLFEESVSNSASELENINSSMSSWNENLNFVRGILYNIGSLNLHSRLLLRSVVLTYENIHYLQNVAIKLFPVAPPRALYQIMCCFDNLHVKEDSSHPWLFLSPIFVDNLINRLRSLKEETQGQDDAAAASRQQFNSSAANITWQLLNLGASTTSEQTDFLKSICKDVLVYNSSCLNNASDFDNVTPNILRSFNGSSMAHCSIAKAALHWTSFGSEIIGPVAPGSQDQFWPLWFQGASNILERQANMQKFTDSLLDRKMDAVELFDQQKKNEFLSCLGEIYSVKTILLNLCSIILCISLKTNNMHLFDTLRNEWAQAVTRYCSHAPISTFQRLYNEISSAEYFLLKNVAFKTVDTKLIDDPLRAKLSEMAALAKEKRLDKVSTTTTTRDSSLSNNNYNGPVGQRSSSKSNRFNKNNNNNNNNDELENGFRAFNHQDDDYYSSAIGRRRRDADDESSPMRRRRRNDGDFVEGSTTNRYPSERGAQFGQSEFRSKSTPGRRQPSRSFGRPDFDDYPEESSSYNNNSSNMRKSKGNYYVNKNDDYDDDIGDDFDSPRNDFSRSNFGRRAPKQRNEDVERVMDEEDEFDRFSSRKPSYRRRLSTSHEENQNDRLFRRTNAAADQEDSRSFAPKKSSYLLDKDDFESVKRNNTSRINEIVDEEDDFGSLAAAPKQHGRNRQTVKQASEREFE